MTKFWTESRIEELRKLWAENLTISEIAEKMCAPSRNSIAGKIHRLGLSRSLDEGRHIRAWAVAGRVELLTQLWSEGHTARAIARKLGDDLSEQAVISKLNRLGFHSTQRKRRRPTGITASAGSFHPVRSESLPPVEVCPAIVQISRSFPKVEGLPAALVNRHERQCGYPMADPADPSFWYCTNERREGSQYCAGHFCATHLPAKARHATHRGAEKMARSE